MSSFPDIVYRVPGPHYGADGRGFDYMGVDSAEALLAALDDGWHLSVADAMGIVPEAEAVIAEVKEAQEAVEAITADTRDELEAKARELGVSFNARTKDETLAERIAAAL